MKKKIYKKWDLHHHIVPDFYVDEMKQMGISVAGIDWPKWNAEASLKMMDRFQIEKAFVSVSTPGVFFKDVAYSQDLTRRCNAYIFSMVQKYPGRFGGFGSVTLPDVPSALVEARYALDILKLDGLALMSNVNGHYLGDPSYKPFYEEMNSRKAVIYVHPNEVTGKADHLFLNPLYLWQNDTTKAIIDFIHSGYHKHFPDIRWVFAHGGGILAPLFPTIIEALQNEYPDIAAELEIWKTQVFLDTASKAFDDQIPYILEFSDTQHVLFGSDTGWGNKMAVAEVEKSYSSLDRKHGLTEQQIEGIFMDNAKRLFSRDRIPVQKDAQAPYARPPFGRDRGRIQYHCHSEEEALAVLASGQYDKVILSLDNPDIWALEPQERQAALKKHNDNLARIGSDHPQRIGGFCAIDPTAPAWSITEIDRGLNELNLDGVCLTLDISSAPLMELFDEQLILKWLR